MFLTFQDLVVVFYQMYAIKTNFDTRISLCNISDQAVFGGFLNFDWDRMQ